MKIMVCHCLANRIIPTSIRNGNIFGFLPTMTSGATNNSVLINENKHNATIIINQPNICNALNMEMIRKIQTQLRTLKKSKSFIILKASEGRYFSSGGDIPNLLNVGLEEIQHFFREVYTLIHSISNDKVPNIALVDGVTLGAGAAIAFNGKYSVATERTVLAMPHTSIGLSGSFHFLNPLNGKLGLYLGMTGNRLMGEDVARVGLATHFCERSHLASLESELVKCKNSNEIPKILSDFSLKIPKEGGISLLMHKINTCFNASTIEEIYKNLEKDGSQWALNTFETLRQKSPLALKLTLRHMQLSANLSLDQSLKMEYRLASRCVRDSNFLEGVRAFLVDKDKNPAWIPRSLDAVTDDFVNEFFIRLPESKELQL